MEAEQKIVPPSPLVTALTEAKESGKLEFTLPVSLRKVEMVRSTGRHQLIAQKAFDPGKNGYQFTMECIRQTMTPQPTPEEMLEFCNEDLDVLQELYSRFNRSGRHSIKDKDLDAFFENR